jgi:ethanolamine utilization protein EutQ (cupin superfamily)
MVVVEGEVAIEHESDSITAGPGTLVQFEPNERRTVTATRDTRVLLILAPWPGVGHPSRRE